MTLTNVRTWRTLAATATGAGHAGRGEAGQDRFLLHHGADGTLTVAVADGAGSARCGGEGADAAVTVAVEQASAGHEPWEAVAAAREAVAGRGPAHEWATTLLVCKIDTTTVSAAQVGDGAIVLRRGDDFVVASPPPGEYLNETVMLTSRNWCEEMAVGVWPASGIDALAVMTDGLAPVAFDLVSWNAHAPFFRPLFDFAASDGADATELEAFLASDRLATRTDDDVTIVLAARAE